MTGKGIRQKTGGGNPPVSCRLAAALLAAVVVLGSSAISASPVTDPIASSIGRGLGTRGPKMLPVTSPVAIARVFAIPGSSTNESWALGLGFSLAPGMDKGNLTGQDVFMRRTRGSEWQYAGTPVDDTGAIVNPQISNFAMTADGEGWAVGPNGSLVHRKPKGAWLDVHAKSPTTNQLNAVCLGSDASGAYGYTVGDNATILKLTDGAWAVDLTAGPTGSTGNTVPSFVSVSCVSRSEAWAVARVNPSRLSLWHRINGAWAQKTTGIPIFDSPPAPIVAAGGSTVNQQTLASAVSASAGSVWISGSLHPVDTLSAVKTSVSTDATRPFVLRYDVASDSFHSWCPRMYQLSNSGVSQTTDVCDEPLPYAVGDLPCLQGFPDGEVLAAGYGMFGYSKGRWTRLPDVASYSDSCSFNSPTEGWVATNGFSTNAIGVQASVALSAGHWTSEAEPAEPMKRWPTATQHVLESIATDPVQPRRAMAVGASGTIVVIEPGVGPELASSPVSDSLHGITWVTHDQAWAVGDNGTILRYSNGSWSEDPASRKLTTTTLFSVAFAGPDHGYAVGANATILSFRNGAWHKDRVPSYVKVKLLSVAAAGNDVFAVGDAGTLLRNSGHGWSGDDAVAKMVSSPTDPGSEANLQSVAGLPDGTAAVGLSRGTILLRKPGMKWQFSDLPPVWGTLHSVALGSDSRGHLVVYASAGFGQTLNAFNNYGITDPTGLLFAGIDGQWRPLAPGHVPGSAEISSDAPVRHDAVYAIATGPGGTGWAAGGFPALSDNDGHNPNIATSSLWRIALSGAPEASESDAESRPRIPSGSVAFGFASDLGCATGLCGSSLGAGDRGQVMSVAAFAQMQTLAHEGTLSFVALGGNLRRTGLPDELEAVKPLFDDLSIPSYAALGPQDLLQGISTSGQNVLPSPGYWESVFADRPAPWGSSTPRPGFVPVSLPGDAQPAAGHASTHYAFDYAPNGTPLFRMIFLDTSRTPIVSSTQNPNTSEAAWLTNVLADSAGKGIPSIVTMSQPLLTGFSTDADAATTTSQLTSGGVSAVLAGTTHLNQESFVGAGGVGFPAGAFGTTGGVLGGSWRTNRGAYASWQMVVVAADKVSGGKAPVEIRSMPLLEGIALNAPEGRFTQAGATLHFNALGRAPDAGNANANGPFADGNEPYATYVPIPFTAHTCAALENADGTGCIPSTVKRPDYAFRCEDPNVCDFVREDPSRPGVPMRDANKALIPDSNSTLMCAFNAGSTYVRVESGLAAARIPVTVSGGKGPCIPDTRPGIVTTQATVKPVPVRHAASIPLRQQSEPQILKPKTFSVGALPALAPPPVQPAPAPPGGGAPKYEEEKEAASEKAEMTALDPHAIAIGSRKLALTGAAEGLLISVFGVAILVGVAMRLQPRTRPRPGRAVAWAGRRPSSMKPPNKPR